MQIVILDGYTITQDDLNFDCFAEIGEVTVYDRTPYEEETVKRIGSAQIVLTSKVPITAAVMDRCPGMEYIGVMATGYNVVDVEAASERKITVTNVPGYGTETVAEFVFALLLHMTRKVSVLDDSVREGQWCKSKDFCYLPCGQVSLFGKTMGIVGFGQIGKKAAQIAQAFGMKVLVHTRHPDEEWETDNLHFASMEEIFENADVLSLHCPLTKETEGMMDEKAFRAMKPKALLINTSRGQLVNEEALAAALREGWIAGAAVDVIEKEPMKENCPLLGIENCIITPHVAWATKECRQILIEILKENVEAYLAKKPVHTVG